MAKYLVDQTIRFWVEADSEEEAEDMANYDYGITVTNNDDEVISIEYRDLIVEKV